MSTHWFIICYPALAEFTVMLRLRHPIVSPGKHKIQNTIRLRYVQYLVSIQSVILQNESKAYLLQNSFFLSSLNFFSTRCTVLHFVHIVKKIQALSICAICTICQNDTRVLQSAQSVQFVKMIQGPFNLLNLYNLSKRYRILPVSIARSWALYLNLEYIGLIRTFSPICESLGDSSKRMYEWLCV